MNRLLRFFLAAIAAFLLSSVVLIIAGRNDLLAGAHLYSPEFLLPSNLTMAIIVGVIGAISPARKTPLWVTTSIGVILALLLTYRSGDGAWSGRIWRSN